MISSRDNNLTLNKPIDTIKVLAVPKKVLMMIKAAKLWWTEAGAGLEQEQGRIRARKGISRAGQEQGRSRIRAGARQKQGRSR